MLFVLLSFNSPSISVTSLRASFLNPFSKNKKLAVPVIVDLYAIQSGFSLLIWSIRTISSSEKGIFLSHFSKMYSKPNRIPSKEIS